MGTMWNNEEKAMLWGKKRGPGHENKTERVAPREQNREGQVEGAIKRGSGCMSKIERARLR